MLPIVEYPGVVSNYIHIFEKFFSKPQLKHFAQYITGLMVSNNKTVTGINRCFVGHNDQSAKNHFITDSNWSDEEFEKCRVETMFEVIKKHHEKDGVLLIDDTLAHKTGKKIEGVGIHFDHSDRRYVLGHQPVTSHWVGKRTHFPVDIELYIKEKDLKDKTKFKSKIDLAISFVNKAVEKGIPFSCVSADSWFFCKRFIKEIERNKKDWVFACKLNRRVIFNNAPMRLSEYIKAIPGSSFKCIEIKKGNGENVKYWYFTKSIRMVKQGRVRIVVTHRDPELKDDPKVLVTNRLEWEAKKIISTYSKRWTIDTFYREAKQSLGFEDCELRILKGVMRHWHLIFVAYYFLQLSSLDRTLSRWFKTNLKTIGMKCQLAGTEILRSFILFVFEMLRQKKDVNDILEYSLSSSSQLKFSFA